MDNIKYKMLPFVNDTIKNEDGAAIGFTVGIIFSDGKAITHTEKKDVILGEVEARNLIEGGSEAYTIWSKSIIDQEDMLNRGNLVMDELTKNEIYE